jgi:hypothetical protein
MDAFDRYKKMPLRSQETKEYKDEDYELRYSRNQKIRAFDKLFDTSIASKLEWKTSEEVKMLFMKKKPTFLPKISPRGAISSRRSKSPQKQDPKLAKSPHSGISPMGKLLKPPLLEDIEASRDKESFMLDNSNEGRTSDRPNNDMQRTIYSMKMNNNLTIQSKDIYDFQDTLNLTKNQINRIMWLDNECDPFKRENRTDKLRSLGFFVEIAPSAEKLKVVVSNALVVTTPTYIENIRRIADIEKNQSVIGIIILVENDFLRNYIHLTKYKKVVDVYSNFEEAFNYIIMAVVLLNSRPDSITR